MKKGLLILGLMLMSFVGAQAIPAYPGIIEHVQPNGDTLRIYLRGDERRHWMQTEDGWRIMHGKKEWLRYAKTNRKGAIVVSCRKAHNAEKRSCCEKRWLQKHGINGTAQNKTE